VVRAGVLGVGSRCEVIVGSGEAGVGGGGVGGGGGGGGGRGGGKEKKKRARVYRHSMNHLDGSSLLLFSIRPLSIQLYPLPI